jgi:hypothetical protein
VKEVGEETLLVSVNCQQQEAGAAPFYSGAETQHSCRNIFTLFRKRNLHQHGDGAKKKKLLSIHTIRRGARGIQMRKETETRKVK